MIKVRLKGGLGNQMFQYAFGLNMASRLNTELKFDLSSLLHRRKQKDFVYRDYDLDIFNLKPQFDINKKLLSTLHGFKNSRLSGLIAKYIQNNNIILKERFFHFDLELYENPRDGVLYDGWWQSHYYFNDIRDQVREAFTFKDEILEVSRELFEDIQNTNSICLNVRRTDFLNNKTLNATDLSYFTRGINYMLNNIDSPRFFIFSDDIEWCEKNFNFIENLKIVDHIHKGRKFGNYLHLMKSCKHFIIPNSSFAYWAAYLNKDIDKVVVAPQNWFTDASIITDDLVHTDWIRL